MLVNEIYTVSVGSKSSLCRLIEDHESNVLFVFFEKGEYGYYNLVIRVTDEHTRNILVGQCIKHSWGFTTKEGGMIDSGYKRVN